MCYYSKQSINSLVLTFLSLHAATFLNFAEIFYWLDRELILFHENLNKRHDESFCVNGHHQHPIVLQNLENSISVK